MLKFLLITQMFSEYLFEIGKIMCDKSFKQFQLIKLGFYKNRHVFQTEIGIFYGKKFPQNHPKTAKTSFFTFFDSFSYSFRATSLQKMVLKNSTMTNIRLHWAFSKVQLQCLLELVSPQIPWNKKIKFFDKLISIFVQKTNIFGE